MTISREAVIWGFRFFLGRDPDSEDVIRAHMVIRDENLLAEALIKSKEFLSKKRFSNLISLKQNSALSSAPKIARVSTSAIKVLVLGNCQTVGLANLFQAMTGDVHATSLELTAGAKMRMRDREIDLSSMISRSDLVFLHPDVEFISMVEKIVPAGRSKIRLMPRIDFSAFHPDLVYIENGSLGRVNGPMGQYQSSLAFYGWVNGFSESETIKLFSEDVYEALGFFDYSKASNDFLLNAGKATGIPLDGLIGKWSSRGCWMHSVNHPKLFVLADLARSLLIREGITPLADVEQYVADNLANGPVWPVYPEIGRRLGIDGNYLFKRDQSMCSQAQPVLMVGLEDFVRESFESFSKFSKVALVCERLNSPRYQGLRKHLKERVTSTPVENSGQVIRDIKGAEKNGGSPYQGLPDHQFWRRAVERIPMKEVDPVVRTHFTLKRHEKIATAGSCFAQHISRTLQKHGFNYFITETGEGLSEAEIQQRNFGVFSARFGNLYTSRQLVQLFDRAYGAFHPHESYWLNTSNQYIDPFRPQIEPKGFDSIEELEKSRAEHFRAVREMFENLDVFVFTLGLTEAWRSRIDGAVYPLAPGVVAGKMEPDMHEFVNFGVSDVVTDMNAFVQRLLRVNPKARVILTVSPVPLIATYENRHALVATTYSKSVLRAAAEEICHGNSICEYFPSYEIITGNYTNGAYFESDLRSVKVEGVDHVMRLFLKHYALQEEAGVQIEAQVNELDFHLMKENARLSKVICDEERIDSGFCG